MSEAVERFLDWKAEAVKAESLITIRNAALRLVAPAGHLLTESLDVRRAQDLYDKLREKVAVATHRGSLFLAREIWAWLIRKKIATANPWVEVDPVGQSNTHKMVHTVEEAQAWLATALELAQHRDDALAAALVLLCQLRATAAATPTARQLDQNGTVLHVVRKGKDGLRPIPVPECLQDLLRARKRDKLPDAPLFLSQQGEPLARHHVWHVTQRICELSGTPPISVHSWRGFGATMMIEAGQDPDFVARKLDHTRQVSERHYVAPGAAEEQRAQNVLRLVKGGRS